MTIGEVGLQTNDVIRLAGFYRALLGAEGPNDDPVHQFILTEGTALTIHNDGTVRNNQNENICLAFTVADVDAEYERVRALGAQVIAPPTTRPWGARNMEFLDPDGNHIFFRSFPESE